MDKLQHLLKAALGQSDASRAPQEPNEFAVQRQRAFEEAVRKIEALRQSRLSRQRIATRKAHKCLEAASLLKSRNPRAVVSGRNRRPLSLPDSAAGGANGQTRTHRHRPG
jgi:hypothetical protein